MQATLILELNRFREDIHFRLIFPLYAPWKYLETSGNFFKLRFCDSSVAVQKLCVSTKFPYQEIRWNYGILCSDSNKINENTDTKRIKLNMCLIAEISKPGTMTYKGHSKSSEPSFIKFAIVNKTWSNFQVLIVYV